MILIFILLFLWNTFPGSCIFKVNLIFIKGKFVADNYFGQKLHHIYLAITLIRPCDKTFLGKVIFHHFGIFVKAAFHKFYLIHSWIICLVYMLLTEGTIGKTMDRKRTEFPTISHLNISCTYFSQNYKYCKRISVLFAQ